MFFDLSESFSQAYQTFNPDYHDKSSSCPAPTPGKSLYSRVECPLLAQELSDILMYSCQFHLPVWKLTHFEGNPFNWHDWSGQFKRRLIQPCSVMIKAKISEKAKSPIAEHSYSGVLCKDLLAILKNSSEKTLKTNELENVVSFSCTFQFSLPYSSLCHLTTTSKVLT